MSTSAAKGSPKVSAFVMTLLFLAFLALLVISIDPLPTWLLSKRGADWEALLPSERIQSEASLRTTLIQAVGGLAVGLGAITALRQLSIARRQATLATETQYVDAFTRALTQLSAESDAVRVAGVYALDRLLMSEATGSEQVCDVLRRFVSQEPARNGTASAAAEVAIRRLAEHGADRNFRGATLPRVDLKRANLEGAIFSDCDLREADFRGAAIAGVDFRDADLSRAKFDAGALEGADTRGARGLPLGG